MTRLIIPATLAVCGCLWAQHASAQTTRPAAPVAGATSQPDGLPAGATTLQAKVVEVRGSVEARSATAGGAFKPVAKDDLLAADTLISVGPKSQAVISFGDNSVVVVEQFSI
ncbi:MAG: hypothetical protein PHU85_07400, partial [Phycisphaerae bacterium]|nr:hypothetical protein [Phycisphaerae bacterium]